MKNYKGKCMFECVEKNSEPNGKTHSIRNVGFSLKHFLLSSKHSFLVLQVKSIRFPGKNYSAIHSQLGAFNKVNPTRSHNPPKLRLKGRISQT